MYSCSVLGKIQLLGLDYYNIPSSFRSYESTEFSQQMYQRNDISDSNGESDDNGNVRVELNAQTWDSIYKNTADQLDFDMREAFIPNEVHYFISTKLAKELLRR